MDGYVLGGGGGRGFRIEYIRFWLWLCMWAAMSRALVHRWCLIGRKAVLGGGESDEGGEYGGCELNFHSM